MTYNFHGRNVKCVCTDVCHLRAFPFSDDHKVLEEDWGMLDQRGGIDLCLLLLIVKRDVGAEILA